METTSSASESDGRDPKRTRHVPGGAEEGGHFTAVVSKRQVVLRYMDIEGFKTFRARERIDFCPGWELRDRPQANTHTGHQGSRSPAPFTVVFGGNGAGKSAVIDAILFVLGQSSKSLRSSKLSQLINDQTVRRHGPKATASVTITFQTTTTSLDDGGKPGVSDVVYLSVRRSVKYGTGATVFAVQDSHCSRDDMLKTLSDFVGTDMADVDRYVLKQGSTMVCRRGGQALLSFIERLAGTPCLKTQVEDTQAALDDSREEMFSLEVQLVESTQKRRQLQPQVDALFVHQSAVSELKHDIIGLWRRQLAVLRIHSEKIAIDVEQCKRLVARLRDEIRDTRARDADAEQASSLAREIAEQGLKAQTVARGNLQKAKAAQAEANAHATKRLDSIKSKSKALARARQLLKEGDAEVVKLADRSMALDKACRLIHNRIDDLERSQTPSSPQESNELDKLLRRLSIIDNGCLAEFQRAMTEREVRRKEAYALLEKLEGWSQAAREDEKDSLAVAQDCQKALRVLQQRVQEVEDQMDRTREGYISQQALVTDLQDRHGRALAASVTPSRSSSKHSRHPETPNNYVQSHEIRSTQQGHRSGSLRSLLERFRADGVCVHGMLADLVMLRRQRDETAVAAVLGPVMRNTIVVQTRKDGARVVMATKMAGIPGRIRCDVLGEIKRTPGADSRGKGASAGQGGRRTGLIPLSECVATSDPTHFPAVEMHLRGWFLAENRQVAWDEVMQGTSRPRGANVVTTAGELFYAGGEVAVKSRQASASAYGQRLAVLRKDGGPAIPSTRASERRPRDEESHKGSEEENVGCLKHLLEEAEASLLSMEARTSELAEASAQARFDLEDSLAKSSAAQLQADEHQRQVARIEHQLHAQRTHIATFQPQGQGDEEEHSGGGDDALKLAKLRLERDNIVAELEKTGWSATAEATSNNGYVPTGNTLKTGTSICRELETLKSDVAAKGAELDEVRMKHRVLSKRSDGRKVRVAALEAEVNNLSGQEKTIKARQASDANIILNLEAALGEATATHAMRQEVAREAEKAARDTRRELDLVKNHRAKLSTKYDSLKADADKAGATCLGLTRSLRETDIPMAPLVSNTLLTCDTNGAQVDGSSKQEGDDPAASRLAIAVQVFAARGAQTDEEVQVLRSTAGGVYRQGGRDATCGEAHETQVVQFMHTLLHCGQEKTFAKETRTIEASIQLKKVTVDKLRQEVNIAAASQASRLDHELVELTDRLDRVQKLIALLVDKKEAVEATRHAALVSCLEEVNESLGIIFRHLTNIQDTDYATLRGSRGTTKLGVPSIPAGDCFLRFSRERSLLLSEGLAIEAKPDASSPWRGPGQLSGGQVALVGLALNLATQAVRPAPLYLMDEIDSALDTHKVRRVAAMLADRAESGNEQCIVISHRPEMHEMGSHLVGVYHCEGTARTVGLKLIRQLPREHCDVYDAGRDHRE